MESFSENFCYDDDEQLPVEPKLIFDPVSLLFLPLFLLLIVLLLGEILFAHIVCQTIENGIFKSTQSIVFFLSSFQSIQRRRVLYIFQ